MDRSDTYHKNAKALWSTLPKDYIYMQTSNYLASEDLSLIQYRIGFEAAIV